MTTKPVVQAATPLAEPATSDRHPDYDPQVGGVPVRPSNDLLAINAEQAAERLSLSAEMVRRLIRDGRLPHIRIGTRVLVPVKALEQWVADHTIPAT